MSVELKRPKIITWVCIAGFILVILSMPQMFSPDTRKMGDFMPALFGLLISLRFIAYVGLWHMKRWGVELFMITLVSQVIQATVMDSYEINPIGLAEHLVAFIIMAVMYKKMDRNL